MSHSCWLDGWRGRQVQRNNGKEPSRKGVGRTGARSVVRGEVVGVPSFLLVAVTAFRAPRRVDRRPLRRAPVADEQR